MGYEMQFAKNMSKIEPRSLGLGLLIGCFLILFGYLSMSETSLIPFTSVNSVSSPSSPVPSSPTVEGKGSSQQLGSENKTEELRKKIDKKSIQQSSPSIYDPSKKGDNNGVKQSGRENKIENQLGKDENGGIPKSFPINNSIGGEDPQMLGTGIKGAKPEMKPICDLHDTRSDLCEMQGDVRIHGRSSSVVFVNSQQMENPGDKGPWRIRPYARKYDTTIMANVREVTVRLSNGLNEASCTIKNRIPAVVLATGGYTGNFYHDFSDVLVPLFTTTRQFDGQVQLLVSHMDRWWVVKYGEILKQLSRYEVIDFDKDDQVRCYPHVILGLHNHKDMSIDPSRAPKGYSMIDFKRLLMKAYSLQKVTAIKLAENPVVKPRLLIMSRGLSRKFVNIGEIAQRAGMLGFEVVISEAKFNTKLSDFAHIVNSCDVMMGVHGAGLTNEIFLPLNGVVIQVVPWGGLEEMARYDFGEPADGMGLKYLQYSIKEEESTLTELYPRDHPVFKDPKSIEKQGWLVMGEIFMFKQNVKLDMDRFSPVLLHALELLKQ